MASERQLERGGGGPGARDDGLTEAEEDRGRQVSGGGLHRPAAGARAERDAMASSRATGEGRWSGMQIC
jgi:hypothetical protein